MIFIFSAPYQYLLENIEFCFHLSSIFWLLTSKIVTEKKTKTFKEKEIWNLTILGVINSNSFRKPRKVKVLLDVLYVEVISVLYMEEKMILIDTPQNIRYIWMLHNKKGN